MAIGPTDAKVTPWIIGIRPPMLPKPNVWINVATPQVNKSAVIKRIKSSTGKCMACATIIGTATAPAYMANTCCKPKAKSCGIGNILSTVFICF